jgi:hypothetical protein
MATAAAVVLMRERRVVEAFTTAAATSPHHALALETLGIDSDGVGVRRLVDRAVLRQSAPGRYYLDVPTWEALRRARRRTVLVLLLILAVLLVVGVIGLHQAPVAVSR